MSCLSPWVAVIADRVADYGAVHGSRAGVEHAYVVADRLESGA
jgi:hypothetical protein